MKPKPMFYRMRDRNGNEVGRIIINENGYGFATLNGEHQPYEVVPKPHGEPWKKEKKNA